MHSPDERSFILSILLFPFLILTPLLLFILSNSPITLIESQSAPPQFPSILVAEPKTEHSTTTTKRQKHMAFQADTYFINPRNYHGTSSFQPTAYQAQKPSSNQPHQHYHMGITTSSTIFQSITPTNNNSNISHKINNQPISTTPIITASNQYHVATAGRTTTFKNIPSMDTNHYKNNNTMPARRMGEADDAQFPKMLDIYSSLPSISSSSFRVAEEILRAVRATTAVTTRAVALAPSWEFILPIRSAHDSDDDDDNDCVYLTPPPTKSLVEFAKSSLFAER